MALQSADPQTEVAVNLPDGQSMHLHSAVYVDSVRGAVVRFESFWKRSLRLVLPKSQHGLLGDLEMVSLRPKYNPTALFPIFVLKGFKTPPFFEECQVVSDSGEVFHFRAGAPKEVGKHFAWCPRLGSFPRRDEAFTLLGSINGKRFVVRIRNPLHGRVVPSWPPRSLPATNRFGDLEIVQPADAMLISTNGIYFSPRVAFYRRGRPIRHGVNVLNCELWDESGNHSNLSTNEPSWKIEYVIELTNSVAGSVTNFQTSFVFDPRKVGRMSDTMPP